MTREARTPRTPHSPSLHLSHRRPPIPIQPLAGRRSRRSCRSAPRWAPGSPSACRPSAARRGRSRSCSARWLMRSGGSASAGSCTRSTTARCCPGPEAQQLATYVGWLLHGTRGGLVAGGLFVLPGVVALLALSAIYVAFGTTTAVTAVVVGLAAAVLAIVGPAVVRGAKPALDSRALVVIAVVAFLALALFRVPF